MGVPRIILPIESELNIVGVPRMTLQIEGELNIGTKVYRMIL